MNYLRWRGGLAALVVALALATSSQAFVVHTSNFDGAFAYSPMGGAVGALGMINPQINTLLGGAALGFNSAAVLQFDFNYTPSYPTPHDVLWAPDKDWKWSVGIQNFNLPPQLGGGALPDLQFCHNASFNEVVAGAMWAKNKVSEHFGEDICWGWAVEWTGANTGVGYLAVAANIDPTCLPGMGQYPILCQLDGGNGSVDIAVEPVPEPLTMVMFGAGLAGLGAVRRRSKKQSA